MAAADEASLSITEAGGELRVGIAGPLTVDAVARLDRQFRQTASASPRLVVIDAARVPPLGAAGAGARGGGPGCRPGGRGRGGDGDRHGRKRAEAGSDGKGGRQAEP